MVFFLASLPSKAYDYLKIVHKKYREGKLKGQHIPRSKKGTVAKPPDIKGSNFGELPRMLCAGYYKSYRKGSLHFLK